jgi:hypothetical protein
MVTDPGRATRAKSPTEQPGPEMKFGEALDFARWQKIAAFGAGYD